MNMLNEILDLKNHWISSLIVSALEHEFKNFKGTTTWNILFDKNDAWLEEMSRRHNVSKERIRQIYGKIQRGISRGSAKHLFNDVIERLYKEMSMETPCVFA